MKATPLPPVEMLRERFDYDPDTGVLRWLASTSNRVKVGSIAGYVGTGGYRRVRVDGRLYLTHRIAYALTTGADIPTGMQIDHINLNRADTRLSNLRLASHADNVRHIRRPRHNTSGFKGVRRHRGQWRAEIRVAGKTCHLGCFTDPILAADVYDMFARHFFGRFARLNIDDADVVAHLHAGKGPVIRSS